VCVGFFVAGGGVSYSHLSQTPLFFERLPFRLSMTSTSPFRRSAAAFLYSNCGLSVRLASCPTKGGHGARLTRDLSNYLSKNHAKGESEDTKREQRLLGLTGDEKINQLPLYLNIKVPHSTAQRKAMIGMRGSVLSTDERTIRIRRRAIHGRPCGCRDKAFT